MSTAFIDPAKHVLMVFGIILALGSASAVLAGKLNPGLGKLARSPVLTTGNVNDLMHYGSSAGVEMALSPAGVLHRKSVRRQR